MLLVGHGTRDEIGTGQFYQLAEVLSELVTPEPVQPCLLELQPPTIREGWRRLVDAGVDHVMVLPLLLFTAGHSREDIPAAVAAAAADTPAVSYALSRPLSRHPQIIRLALERLTETFARDESLDAARTAVVMVGRGSSDPCARSDMFFFSEVISAHLSRSQLSVACVETAFYAMCEPRVPDVLDRVARRGDVRNIVVQPHLLFEGRLNQGVLRLVREAASRHPRITFRTSGYLGPDPRIAAALWDRAAQFAGRQPVELLDVSPSRNLELSSQSLRFPRSA